MLSDTQKNTLHSLALLTILVLIMLTLGWMLFDTSGLVMGIFISAILLIAGPRFSHTSMIRASKATILPPHRFPQLYSMTQQLMDKAGLKSRPTLYCMRSDTLNAFTTGPRENAAIVVTDSLLRTLNAREITNILAHEIGHIKNNDLYLMSIADSVTRLTNILSILGQLALLLALPALFMGQIQIPLIPLILLIFAPNISILLQMALFRTREYAADLTGAELSGDAAGLASALAKIQDQQKYGWHHLFMPWQRKIHSLLLTHPQTEDRIKRLIKFSKAQHYQSIWFRPIPHG